MINLSRKLLVGAVAVGVASVVGVRADAPHMVITSTPGTQVGIPVNDIQQITFDGTTMTVTETDGVHTVDVKDVKALTFDYDFSSVDNVEQALDDVAIKSNGSVVTISSLSGKPVTVQVYNLQGVEVVSHHGADVVTVDFGAYAPGVYIIKAQDKVIKFNNR